MAASCKVFRRPFHRLILNSIQTAFVRSYVHHNKCNGESVVNIKHGVRQLFQPIISTLPKALKAGGGGGKQAEAISNSQKLMLEYGVVRHSTPGTFHYLPLAIKSLNKLIRIIDEEMERIGGQKVDMPCLISKNLWQATGRWDAMGEELFKLHDRQHRDLCLGPTHEEMVTELISSTSDLSHKQLPLLIYQIAKKFRDEIKPRFGLLRAREFLMKDLYSFDATDEEAKMTYEKVGQAYQRLLNRLGLKFIQVEADPGKIGGNVSHEFHLPADIGEDHVVLCQQCNYASNAELHGSSTNCKSCGSQLKNTAAIEVAHSFLLGTKYSKPLKATFTNTSSQQQLLVMGCYGVGVSRLLAASLEVLSSAEVLRWPTSVAPYQICIIPPKAGSKESQAESMAIHVYDELSKILPEDVIYDNRVNSTIGFRLLEAKRIGYPYVVIVGKTVLESVPKFEVHDVYKNLSIYMTHNELFQLADQIRMNSL